jgi:small subunit ribosomal protein S10
MAGVSYGDVFGKHAGCKATFLSGSRVVAEDVSSSGVDTHMTQRARIRLSSTSTEYLDGVCNQIKRITRKTGVRMAGPIPLPTRRMIVPTRKTPCGQGSESWDKWEMRIHKRLIDIDADERAIRQIMRVKIPDSVYIEIELTG